jgi:ubiquinone/menaquinone biosynthesis C-methylase UbiE
MAVLLLLILIYFSNFSILLILLTGIIVIPVFVFFGTIFFKKQFTIKREKILKKMINLANLKGDELVLDLGTGSGFLAIGFAKNLNKGKVIGLDRYSLKNGSLKSKIISIIKINFIENSLKNAKLNAKIEKVENKCEFISADITKSLNFPDNNFDIILTSQVFYCLPSEKMQDVFEEINRVLKKKGKIIFFETLNLLSWDLNNVKKYFEKEGYNVDLLKSEEFERFYILYGEK